ATMVQNQEMVASRSAYSSQQYQEEMNRAISRQAGEQVAGVDAGAAQSIGGYRSAAAESRRGVDQNYQAELGANKQIFVTQVDAAGGIRAAGIGGGETGAGAGE